MTIRNLSVLFQPRSVVLVGASTRPGALGAIVLENVLAAGFPGTVYAVNPHPVDRAGVIWVPSIEELPEAPELAVVLTPAQTVPDIIGRLGARGTKCAVVITAEITEANGLRQRMLDAAKPHCLRIVGPNCLGIMAPHAQLDATFASTPARRGRLGLVSQSGALVTALLDWAERRGIGFSGIASVGDMADVDLGDMIDLFAVDPETEAILLYIEGVTDAAKFLSAARAAAVHKPVIAIKTGRSAEAAKAALSHTGALAGSYDVYRAAFARAGIVAVDTLTELFDAAQILCNPRRALGERLGVVTNGGGAGILAVDAMAGTGARLAPFTPETMAALDAALPLGWSRGDPADIRGDAGPDAYAAAIGPLLADETVDALLVMNCPTGKAEPTATSGAVTAAVAANQGDKPVLACWLGDSNADAASGKMREAGIPLYTTPDDAVRGFGYLLAAKRAREALTDAPAETRDVAGDIETARRIVAGARADGRTLLHEVEAKALFAAYGIPVGATRLAPSPDAVEETCAGLTPPFAVKIVSPEIVHKSEAGGVALRLADGKAAALAAQAMAERMAREHPEARIIGYAVEEMISRPHAQEVFAGIATDATFGPLLMVGAGGTAIEVIADKALALPPIDNAQALALINQTRISKLLAGYRNVPPADVDGLAGVLRALSAMTVELPDILELDINPLLIDADGVVALDARIRISDQAQENTRLVIRPAPMHWAGEIETRSGQKLFVRPVRADDEALLGEFFAHVSPEDLRFRFLSRCVRIDHDLLTMMTRVDYRRTITFLAFDADRKSVLATAMLAADPDRTRAEVALATRSDMKNRGISWSLFEHVLRYAEAERIGVVEAIECADHEAALRMEREMGFTARSDPDDPTLRIVRRDLSPPA